MSILQVAGQLHMRMLYFWIHEEKVKLIFANAES